jgi:hypothetical protein
MSQDEIKEDGPSGDPVEPTPAEAELTALREKVSRLEGVVGDPDVAAVVAAKDKKQSIRLVVGEGPQEDGAEAPPPAIPDDSELDGMTNSQLVKAMMAQMGAVVKRGLEETGLPRTVEGLAAERADAKKAKMKTEAETLKAQFPDFLTYKDQIVQLAKSGLSLQESYLVARTRAGKGLPAPRPTASERPTAITFRERKEPRDVAPGSRGFEDALRGVLEEMEIPEDFGL